MITAVIMALLGVLDVATRTGSARGLQEQRSRPTCATCCRISSGRASVRRRPTGKKFTAAGARDAVILEQARLPFKEATLRRIRGRRMIVVSQMVLCGIAV